MTLTNLKAVAVQRGDRVHVSTNATGLARRFDFAVGSWRRPLHALGLFDRIEEELRRRGVRWSGVPEIVTSTEAA